MQALESDHKSITELVTLLEDVKSALRLFVKVGNAVKWLSGILLACSGIAWVVKHFGSGV